MNVYGSVLQTLHFWQSLDHNNAYAFGQGTSLHTMLLLEYLLYSCTFALCDYSCYPNTKNLQMVSFWVTWRQSGLCDYSIENTYTKWCLVMFPDMEGILQCMVLVRKWVLL